MHEYLAVLEGLAELGIAATEMLYPDRSIGQDHRGRGRRRGAARKSSCVPPKAASLRPASRAIKASSPARISAVFSLIPVSRLASSMR